MKVPGLGEVKPPVVYGTAAVVGIGIILWWRKRNAATAAAASASVAPADSSAIDPATGIPYSQETGSAYGSGYGYGSYGGVDPSTGVPYIYETGTTGTGSHPSGITTNSQWAQQAEGSIVSDFGYSLAIAQSAVRKYMAQSPSGLNSDEYSAMSAVIAELGPPPVGTFRLIQAPLGVTTPPGGTPGMPKVGATFEGPWLVKSGQTPQGIASHFGIQVSQITASNPGVAIKPGVTLKIPWLIQSGQTLQSIARAFGVDPAHIAPYVPMN